MKPDFNAMTKTELRAYLVAYPNNQEVFYAFVDRFTAQVSTETFAMPQSQAEIKEVEKLVQQKAAQTKMS